GKILEAMGPFGVQAGQIIRANGFGSMELLEQLNRFYNDILPPLREQVIDDIHEIFGDAAEHIRIREVKGSGSINYVVGVDFLDEDGNIVDRAAVRIQKDNIANKAANESDIWKSTTEKLRANYRDKSILQAADRIDTIRELTA